MLKVSVADFETTTQADDCRVWAWGMVDIEKCRSGWNVEIGNSIDSFMEYVFRESQIINFHNLKFDGSFILDWLFRSDYTFTEEERPRNGQFSTVISSMNQWYIITVRTHDGNQIEFRDSAKKLPMPVKRIANAFKLFEKKGEIDYHAYRAPGHTITPEERSYIVNDVLIVAKALKLQIDQGLTKLTVGADALAEYKSLAGKAFDGMFPILSDTLDGEIRDAYRGGFTHVAKRFRGKLLGKGKTFDVNSLYPSVMYNKLLPYGEPVFREGLPVATKLHPLFIVSVTFTATLKKNHVPCIQIKNSRFHNDVEYLEVIEEPVTLACTNVDLDLWMEHYDMAILSFNGGWCFQGAYGVFNDYIDKWSEIKANSEGGLRELAKLQLNSLYGKFATNPDITPNVPRLEDNIVKFSLGKEKKKNPVYTAMGVFITAYARDITIRAAQQHYDVFAYADTDSLHLLTEETPTALDIHPNRLGAWKHEYDFEAAFFARSKAYTELKTGWKGTPWALPYETHISGMPTEKSKYVTFDDYVSGKEFDGNLKQRRVPGGVVLVDSGFTLKF